MEKERERQCGTKLCESYSFCFLLYERVVQSLALVPELRVHVFPTGQFFLQELGETCGKYRWSRELRDRSLVKKVLMKPVLNFNLMRRVRLPVDVSRYTRVSDVTPTEGGL